MSTDVPCAGCTQCCRKQLVPIIDKDLPRLEHYQVREVETPHGPAVVLLNKPNGDCIHLGDQGCTIYEHRPEICRVYDCRKQFSIMTRQQRRQWDNQQIWREARRRLSTLDAEDKAALASYRASAEGCQPL